MSAATSGIRPTAATTPADQALAEVADFLLDDGFGLTIPAWDASAYLKIANATGALCDLTITEQGDLIWEYRSIDGRHVHPAQLVVMTLDLLDPDAARPQLALVQYCPETAIPSAEPALIALGMTATRELIDETPGLGDFAEIAATNPRKPERGTVRITDDGELRWDTRAPHHPLGGLPLHDIAAAITRALAGVDHVPNHA